MWGFAMTLCSSRLSTQQLTSDETEALLSNYSNLGYSAFPHGSPPVQKTVSSRGSNKFGADHVYVTPVLFKMFSLASLSLTDRERFRIRSGRVGEKDRKTLAVLLHCL